MAASPTSAAPDGDAPDHSDIGGLGYEQARQELVGIVAQLEGGQVGLEESMTLWHRGEALARHCTGWLDRAEATIAEATDARKPSSTA